MSPEPKGGGAPTSAQFDVRAELHERVIHIRMSGFFQEPDMRALVAASERATDEFRGRRHMVIADMRGMKPLYSQIAQLLGEGIRYGRQHGAVLCAHLSDHTVQRLQAARLVREISVNDEVTVDVQSVEEAIRVVDEARPRLDDPRYTGSIRDARAA